MPSQAEVSFSHLRFRLDALIRTYRLSFLLILGLVLSIGRWSIRNAPTSEPKTKQNIPAMSFSSQWY